MINKNWEEFELMNNRNKINDNRDGINYLVLFSFFFNFLHNLIKKVAYRNQIEKILLKIQRIKTHLNLLLKRKKLATL